MTGAPTELSLREWLRVYDLADVEPAVLLDRFARGLIGEGVPLARASIWLPTSHPELCVNGQPPPETLGAWCAPALRGRVVHVPARLATLSATPSSRARRLDPRRAP